MEAGEILDEALVRASTARHKTLLSDESIRERIDFICRCTSNRSCVRLLLSCLLAKIHKPHIDVCKPYTEIGTQDSFSGRGYDEHWIAPFISEHRLPVNSTTAFLTPVLRNINRPLSIDIELIGRPRELYQKTLLLLDDVAADRLDAGAALAEAIRVLLLLRDEKLSRIESLVDSLKRAQGSVPLSSEAICTLVGQHLRCKNASRLPVLVLTAAYKVLEFCWTERARPLNAHNAADRQTGALGDIEIFLEGEDVIVTVYEMKLKCVSRDDIDVAKIKIARAESRIQNYLFVTTDPIDSAVAEYAADFYEESGGIEIAIIGCLDFLRQFLHLFHRQRMAYLDEYQLLVLKEPDSAVNQSLKEAFLALRNAAESGE